MSIRPPIMSIALLSASSLAYEILLIHLFSIINYQYFAYMAISLALLGYGASGTCLSIWGKQLASRYQLVYLTTVVLFACSVLGSFLLAQLVPFNGEEIVWNSWQFVYLGCQFVLLMLPFFLAAVAIGLTLSVYSAKITIIYGFDLIGAGLGSLAVIGLLFVLLPEYVLICLSCIGFLAALTALWEMRIKKWALAALAVLLLTAVIVIIGSSTTLKISTYKSLAYYLNIKGSRIVEVSSSPLGMLHVVENTLVPFRHVPGLSILAEQEPLPQVAVFTNGDNLSVITQKAGNRAQLSYLDQLTSALPYHLKKIEDVLILGVGGGADILQAKYNDVENIVGVELNPQIVNLLKGKYADYSGLGDEYSNNIYTGDIRAYMSQNRGKFDLIQLSLGDSFSPSVSGMSSLRGDYLYTVEAIEQYMAHLSTNGYLSISRWIKNPPRDTLKLFATAVKALKRTGVSEPATRLVLIRSWQTSTLLIKMSGFTEHEIRIVEDFSARRSFDIGYTFLTKAEQVNSFNILRQPLFYMAARAMVSGRTDSFIAAYKFNIEPATDDRPYFHQFFKWSSLQEIVRLQKQGGMSLIESGYLVLLGTLLTAVLLSFVLIIVPLLFLKRRPMESRTFIRPLSVFFYFFLAGIAFLFLEIAFMQKFTLYLQHPIYSVGICLSSFLAFAGFGSIWSSRLKIGLRAGKVMLCSVLGVVLVGLVYQVYLGDLFDFTSSFSLLARACVTISLIAPLAFFMGMPFPLALSALTARADYLIPWAWGINGCASVISAMAAAIISIHLGFSGLLLLGLALYPLMYLLFPATE